MDNDAKKISDAYWVSEHWKSHGKSNPLNTFKIPQIAEESFPENNIILSSFSKNF